MYRNASYFMKPRGEENKVYAKQNQADSNVLMRENTTEETNNLKEEFGKQIQDIEKESNEKQEPKSVDEMILEQPQLLRDVNFVQQNYDAVSKAVNAQPSLMQYIGSQNGWTPSCKSHSNFGYREVRCSYDSDYSFVCKCFYR